MLVTCKTCGKVIGNIEDCVVESFRNGTNSEFLVNYHDMITGEVKEFHCVIYDGEFYCLDCKEKDFVECGNCGDILHNDEEYYTEIDVETGKVRFYCTTCYDEVSERLKENTNT